MEFGYFLHRVMGNGDGSRTQWVPVAFESVLPGVDGADFADPAVSRAVAGLSAWAGGCLAGQKDEFQLYLAVLATVDEDGDEDRILAEQYRVQLEGSVLPTGVVDVYPDALKPCG